MVGKLVNLSGICLMASIALGSLQFSLPPTSTFDDLQEKVNALELKSIFNQLIMNGRQLQKEVDVLKSKLSKIDALETKLSNVPQLL